MRRISVEPLHALMGGLACMALFAFEAAFAQPNASVEEAGDDSIPRMTDGRPDLSGVWWGGSDVGGAGFAELLARGGDTSFVDLYQPWAAERAAQLGDRHDPTLRCVPTAFGTLNVRLWDVGAVGQIVSTPEFMVFLTETYHGWQIIPTDGRAHRDYLPPSWRGDAVGRWEDDTFVVETKNFTDETWISAEGRVSFHSDALRIVERYRRIDANTLEVDATLYDPEVLTEPWVVPTQRLEIAPFDQIMPLNCSGVETQALMDAAADLEP